MDVNVRFQFQQNANPKKEKDYEFSQPTKSPLDQCFHAVQNPAVQELFDQQNVITEVTAKESRKGEGNMKGKTLSVVLLVGAIVAVLGGCSSQNEKEISQQKDGIDKQKDIQMKMIDDQANDLKKSTDLTAKKSDQLLNKMKAQKDVNKELIAEQKKFVQKRADLNKRNLDEQVSADKTQVNWNADSVKEQIDQSASVNKRR